ncbi:hypothetical protein BCR39DRAFT_148581 [Naematelia encephala]|uniref:AMP-dependent synthetase/ligase domain-containing protein n=1 Tax=Naematelia encephala TaxID=71784 RepID=A0A1Y2B788_9TREE|nr:hypothetical protein BCR39DRAFT_148581 [Naematelia encephala]
MFSFLSKKQACVPLPSDPSVRRCYLSPNELVTRPFGDEVQTVGDIFSFIAKRYGGKEACAYREIMDIVEEKKLVQKSDGSGEEEKVWKYFTLSDPKPVTYIQLDTYCTTVCSALVALGFTDPSAPIASRPRVSIYADTCLNWQLMAQSFARLGHVITTAYTTLGEEGLLTSLVEPDVELVFCGEDQIRMIAAVVERAERVKYVVYDGGHRVDQTAVNKVKSVLAKRQGRLLSFDELMHLGKQNPITDFGYKPTPDDIFCIMYTSGSTGPPKGVLLAHKNVIAALAGSTKLWGPGFYPKTDLLLAYLPLTHILAQFLEYTFYLLGVKIGYATVKTLLDDSVRGCKGDFSAFQPTLIGGVPAVYEMIRKGMMKKIADAGPVVGAVFGMAVKGKQTLPWPLNAAIDKVLFARVKQATGGRLRLAVCGGGALSKQTQLFLSTVLAPMMQDQPELGYLTSKTPSQGEIWLRGPNIFQGYFKQEQLTKESFTDDGWFKTGDIGQWEADGTLTIIDRVKNLIKMQNGEYLALDKVESVYKATDVVMMLCINAPPGADRPVAVVYPHEGNLRNHLRASKLPADGTPAQWTNDKQVKQYILNALLARAKEGGLTKAEMVRDVIITKAEWSPDNGMLTPSMKLARPFIAKTYASEIDAAYS